MKRIDNPAKAAWGSLLQRPAINHATLENTVQEVLDAVQQNGDEAIQQLTARFDGVMLRGLAVTEIEISESANQLDDTLKKAIAQAAANIKKFHEEQVSESSRIETMPGVVCWRKPVGIEKVGLYIPGGSAPLFSTVLMLAIPAKLAGCKEIVLCTPPAKDGSINPAILYAAMVAGVTRVFKAGGAQAIAAMAFGTQSIPKVAKIFGPGNQYVTCAKQLVQQYGVAIDMPAGPSEVCVMADDTAIPAYVAADLLSQAEHGPDSQVILVAANTTIADSIIAETYRQLNQLPRRDIAEKALQNSKAIVMDNTDAAIELINQYAPEHLIISYKNDEQIAEKIINAGSVFLGNYSPESVGDYASGTNHTLPTNGYATAYSGVSIDSFVKKITFQKLTHQGLNNIAGTVIPMAEAEGLHAHANAVKVRLNNTL